MSFNRAANFAAMSLFAVFSAPGVVSAQSAAANVSANCTQSGNTMTCTTTSVYTLPANVQLQGQTSGTAFTLTQAAAGNQPNCGAGLSGSPNPATVSTQQVTLSVSCTSPISAALQYYWNGATTPVSNNSTLFQPFLNSNAPYYDATVRVCNTGQTDSANCTSLNTNLTIQTTTVTAPSGCSINSSSPSSVSAGTGISMNVTCSGGSAATSYQWFKDGSPMSGQTGATLNDTPFLTTNTVSSASYTATASNSAGTSPVTAARAFTRAAPPAGDFCGPNDATYTTASAPTRYLADTVNMGPRTITIPISVTANDTTTGRTQLPFMMIVERPGTGNLAFREVTISRSKCNFSNNPEFVIMTLDDYAFTGTWNVKINDSRPLGIPNLTTGTWYINIRNQSCGGGSCDVRFEYQGFQSQ